MSDNPLNPSNNNSGITDNINSRKNRNLKKVYISFFKYISRYKWKIMVAAILSLIGAILNLIGPNKLSEVTNLITEGFSTSIDLIAIQNIVILLVFLYIAGFIFNYIQGWIMATLSQYITQNMRRDITLKINLLPLRYFDSHPIGDTLSRITNDVDTIGQTMNQSISTLTSSVAMLFGSVIMMFLINWIMAVTAILSALIGFVLMLLIISKSQKYFSQQQSELGTLNSHIEEIYSGHTVVKAYNAENESKKIFQTMNDNLYINAWKSQFLSGLMMPIMIFIGNLAYIVVCITGAILMVQDSITFGIIVAFMLYIRLFTQPLQNLSQVISSLQSMAAACERVFEFLDEEEMEEEHKKTKKLNNISGNISFYNVKFGYSSNKIIIQNFSCNIKAGQKIAIVGPTGCGKTTIANLLMRFYEVNGGYITIDGIPINILKRSDVHNLFAMVLQDTWIFEGTLRENLVYNKPEINDKKLDEICAATGLTTLVNQLPQGYDTILNDHSSISIGQKQLVTIARAMIKDAPLLILDEATSNIDTRTELQVQKATDELTKGRTSFVIAHRLSTIKNADLIFVMKDGNIIENGNHYELLAKGGEYFDLYNSQFIQLI